MESSLSQADREKLNRVFGSILDPVLVRYLDEAKRCVEVNACRAAIVLAWCAVIYHLHRQVEMMGFEYFERLYRKQYARDRHPRIRELSDLREIKDAELLEILLKMDILHSEEEFKTLDDFRRLRNDCAHAEPRDVTQKDVLHHFEKIEPFVTRNPGADRDYRSPHYVADLVEDTSYELSLPRARGLIEGIRQEDFLPLVDRLVKLYFDNESSEEQQERVQLLWHELDLDDHSKVQANRKIADRLDRTSSLSQIQARQLVFWSKLSDTEQTYCRKIVSNLLPELESVVTNGPTSEDDLPILQAMIENSTGRNRGDCERLYEKAQLRIFGPDLDQAKKQTYQQLDSLSQLGG